MRDLLVTGHRTGVGKTVIAAALVTALRAQGVRALGFKPAQTGVDEPGRESDADLLAARLERARRRSRSPLLQLREPLAPAVAAERAGVVDDPRHDIEARVEQLRSATAYRW